MKARIEVAEGDLAATPADAVVCASPEPAGASGGAAEGPGGGASGSGEAPRPRASAAGVVVEPAGSLPARFVIRVAVAGEGGEVTEQAVRAAFRAALGVAREHGFASLAVGALGAGPGGLSLRRSAEVLLEETRRHLSEGGPPESIRFVVPGEQALRIFEGVHDSVRIAEQMERLGRR